MLISQKAIVTTTDESYYGDASGVSLVDSDDSSASYIPNVISYLFDSSLEEDQRGKRQRLESGDAWTGYSDLPSTTTFKFPKLTVNVENGAIPNSEILSDQEDINESSEISLLTEISSMSSSSPCNLEKENKNKQEKVEMKETGEKNTEREQLNEKEKENENQEENVNEKKKKKDKQREEEGDSYNPDINYFEKFWLLSISNKVLLSQLNALRKDNSEYTARLEEFSKKNVIEQKRPTVFVKAVSTGMPIQDHLENDKNFVGQAVHQEILRQDITSSISRRSSSKKTFQLKFTPLSAAPRFDTKNLSNDFQQSYLKLSSTPVEHDNIPDQISTLSGNSHSNELGSGIDKQSWPQQRLIASLQTEWNSNSHNDPYSKHTWVVPSQLSHDMSCSNPRRAGPSMFRKSKNQFWKNNVPTQPAPALHEYNSDKLTSRNPLTEYTCLPLSEKTRILPKSYNSTEIKSWKEDEVELVQYAPDVAKTSSVSESKDSDKSVFLEIPQLSSFSHNFVPGVQNTESFFWPQKDANISCMHSAIQDTTSIFTSDVGLASRRVDALAAAWF